jgi:hypothetical protein
MKGSNNNLQHRYARTRFVPKSAWGIREAQDGVAIRPPGAGSGREWRNIMNGPYRTGEGPKWQP